MKKFLLWIIIIIMSLAGAGFMCVSLANAAEFFLSGFNLYSARVWAGLWAALGILSWGITYLVYKKWDE